jgi:dienelactone hydrolase
MVIPMHISKLAVASCIVLASLLATPGVAADSTAPAIHVGDKFDATDTLACGDESSAECKEYLAGLSWKPSKFTVQVEETDSKDADYLVRFPSARPIGNDKNDLVAIEWYAARDKDKAIPKARAVVVVHESGSHMTVGRLIARNIRDQGLHAFLVELPGYGARRDTSFPMEKRLLGSMRQGFADVRRARDAVVAIPAVDASIVGLQGTSLGGFVAATVAGLDHGYDRVFILLAGGNLEDVVFSDSKEAMKLREKLSAAGVTNDQIREFAHQADPLRVACRIRPDNTWLYSAQFDSVVPPASCQALAKAAHLPKDHYIEFAGTHYTGIIFLPSVIHDISQRMMVPVDNHAKD